MIRGIAHNPGDSVRSTIAIWFDRFGTRRLHADARMVIVEDEGARILLIALSAHAQIPRTQIAFGINRWSKACNSLTNLIIYSENEHCQAQSRKRGVFTVENLQESVCLVAETFCP